MKIDFKAIPLPVKLVFKGKELEEIHERMRQWLKENHNSRK